MRILFLGSPNFAKIILESLLNNGHKVVAVVCQPDRPAERGKNLKMPEIKPFAIENKIPVLQFDRVNEHIEEIKKLDFDIFVTASFGQILSRDFLSLGLGLNVHPSLLPQLRGATPIQTALLMNLKQTGVTIQKMKYELDAGDILEQESIDINENDDYCSLEFKLAKLSCNLLQKALQKIQNNTAVFIAQKGTPTFTKLIKKDDGFLDFTKSASELLGKVKALAYNPGCYFFIDKTRIKILKAKTSDDRLDIGEISSNGRGFVVGCSEGSLEILELITPNGKRASGQAFLNGYHGERKVNN